MVFAGRYHGVLGVTAHFAFTAALQFSGNTRFLLYLGACRCLKLRLGARNLLDPQVRTTFISDFGERQTDFGGRYVFRSYRRGITFTLGLTADF